MEQWRTLGAQAVAAVLKPFVGEPKTYPSRRQCPECSGRMNYVRTRGLSNKYARKCTECGFTDASGLKLVRQL
jgi:hypothetical protein